MNKGIVRGKRMVQEVSTNFKPTIKRWGTETWPDHQKTNKRKPKMIIKFKGKMHLDSCNY